MVFREWQVGKKLVLYPSYEIKVVRIFLYIFIHFPMPGCKTFPKNPGYGRRRKQFSFCFDW